MNIKKTTSFTLTCTLACTIALSSCTGLFSSDLQERVDSLENLAAQQDKELTDVNNFMETISEGLDSIAIQQGMLLSPRGGEGKATKEDIRENIDAFERLLARQRITIKQLEEQLDNSNANNKALKSLIDHLSSQIEEKDKMIANLRKELENSKADIAALNEKVTNITNENVNLSNANAHLTDRVNQQENVISSQASQINECFIKVGSTKELKAAGIIEGGSLLKKKSLNSENINTALFKKADTRTVSEIPVPDKPRNVKIMTQVPESSYVIEEAAGGSVIRITNKSAFWSLSKILVVRY